MPVMTVNRAPAIARAKAPVIAGVCCQDIKVSHMQKIVNAAPTPGEGGRGYPA